MAEVVDILVLGAGMCGLGAATSLREMGHRMVVLDKSRGVGGRLAGRRFGGATFDMGPSTSRVVVWPSLRVCRPGEAKVAWCPGSTADRPGRIAI